VLSTLLFKLLIVAGWLFFAFDAVVVIVLIPEMVSPSPGADAAGRAMGEGLGVASLALLLIGGTGLYFSMRAHSWLGAIGSIVPLSIPAMFFGAGKIDFYLYNRHLKSDESKIGRYSEPAQTELAKTIRAGDFEATRKILATHPNLNGRDEAGYDLLSLAVLETLGSSHPGPGSRGDCPGCPLPGRAPLPPRHRRPPAAHVHARPNWPSPNQSASSPPPIPTPSSPPTS